MARSKRKKRRQRDCCQICGEVFPLATHYDAEGYEELLLNHMMKCSASPSPAREAGQERTPSTPDLDDDGDGKPAAKKLKTDDNRKVAAINISKMPPSYSACDSTESLSLGGDEGTKPAAALLPKTLLPMYRTNKPKAKPSMSKPNKKRLLVPSSSQTSNDTAETASMTTETISSTPTTISVSSGHFLAQTWWREKTVRKSTGVSIPFNLESCVSTSTAANDSNNDASVPERQTRSTRRKAETLVLSCPICQKPFNKSNMTEDAMSRHVQRCSKEHLHETRPRQAKPNASDGDSTKKVNMARNLAFVAAMSRPRHQQVGIESRIERERVENERQASRAVEVAAHRASMHFLTRGAGERALNNWIVKGTGEGLGRRDDFRGNHCN